MQHWVGQDYASDVGLAALDMDRDGWTDLVYSGVWFRNTGKPRREPFERLVLDDQGASAYDVVAADLDGDGQCEVVMNDADIVESKMTIMKNADGKGGKWTKQELPQSFAYGSLHALVIADFNQDGRWDIVFNEQEELLNHTSIPDG